MKKGIDYVGVSITFFCHDREGNFLMALRSENCRDEHNTWDIGSGGLEFGDSIIETLKKEILEEYTTSILEHEFLGYRDVHRLHEGVKTQWVMLDFKVLINKDKAGNGEPHKFKEVKWFRLDDLPDNLHSQFNKYYETYKEKLN
ncbi:NUDIX hydrolase [Candidatus Woesearchaeota archaeon]|nr:NUDIX hydrolase [Candidatus Woesearchaeota archaeon]